MEENLEKPKPSYSIMTDIIDLPSKGILYKNKKSQVTYEYMCAKDESILLAPALIRANKQFDELIRVKVKDLEFEPSELLPGDYNLILLQLRVTAYGEIYETRVTSPFTGEEFDAEVDILNFNIKEFSDLPDDEGHFSYIMKNGTVVKFKMLTIGQLRMLEGSAEANAKISGGRYNLLTEKMRKQIVSVNGNTDDVFITNFVERMKIMDARELRKHFNEVEAGLDLNYEFTCPKTATKFSASVSIGSDFFYPQS